MDQEVTESEPLPRKLRNIKLGLKIGFEAYGVKVGVESNSEKAIQMVNDLLPNALPCGRRTIDFKKADHIFSIYTHGKRPEKITVYKGAERSIYETKFQPDTGELLESKIRLTVAEFAKEHAFIHAGAIGYKGKAILLPGRSFAGKTTLVAEFCKNGFDYYSDEYAVIDKDGLVHPYPKMLSMRGIIDDWKQVDIPVEEMGGKKGTKPIPVGMILVTQYKKNSRFLPKTISTGGGIIESINNSVSIRQNPEFVLKVLGKVINDAKVVKTNRTEAPKFLEKFLVYLDEIGF